MRWGIYDPVRKTAGTYPQIVTKSESDYCELDVFAGVALLSIVLEWVRYIAPDIPR